MSSNLNKQFRIIFFSTLCFMQILPTPSSDQQLLNNGKIDSNQKQQTIQENIEDLLKYDPHNRTSDGRVKRSNSQELKIDAMNKLIKEHRTILNHLLNTSINATFMKKSIHDHHENTTPSLRSWRDITDLICLSVLLGCFLYVLIIVCRFCLCHRHSRRSTRYFAPKVKQKTQLEQALEEHLTKQIALIQRQQKRPSLKHKNFKKNSNRHKTLTRPATPSLLSEDADYISEYDNNL